MSSGYTNEDKIRHKEAGKRGHGCFLLRGGWLVMATTTRFEKRTLRYPYIKLKRCDTHCDKTNMAHSGHSNSYMRVQVEGRQSFMTPNRVNRNAAPTPHFLPIASTDLLLSVLNFLLQSNQNLQVLNGSETGTDPSFAAVERSRGQKLERYASDRISARSPSLTLSCPILGLQDLPTIVDARCNAHFP